MQKNLGLNSLIRGQFPNDSAFADHIGWPRQRLSRIQNGDQKPTIEDVERLANGLNVPFMMVAKFFLTRESTNG